MSVEQKLNAALQKYPFIKKGVKRAYQLAMYAVSPKLKSEGNLTCLTPDDEFEYFFGYYDKCPWDASGRYVLCNRVKNAYAKPDNDEPAELVMIDTKQGNALRVLAKTRSWNVQQGCMLQWLGPDFRTKVIYNDFRDGKYCAVILTVETGEERTLPMPVYAVSADGTFALTLDFSRLHRMRPGYGYCNLPEETAQERCPEQTCIWKMELDTGAVTPVLRYTDFLNFEQRPEMVGAAHKVNHLMISPDAKRFMVLHRWFVGERKYTRLITANIDGSEMYNLLDDDFASHCYWKNGKEIITFAEKKGIGRGYFLLRDQGNACRHLWSALSGDGHPSYGPGGKVVTDTYPDRRRVASVYILDDSSEKITVAARVFAPFRYDNDVRCDLHPRWSRDGKQICIDSVFEGKRRLYVVNLSE